MATSGTFTWRPTVHEIIDEAAERARLDALALTPLQQFSTRRSLSSILTAWANEGINQWRIESRTQTMTDGDDDFVLTTGDIDILFAVLRRSGVDTPMIPISREEYLAIPDKTVDGRPDRYMIEKDRDLTVTCTVWPVPENSTDVMAYNALRLHEDVKADMTQHADVHRLYMDALFDALALRMAKKWSGITITRPDGTSYRQRDEKLIESLERDANTSYLLAKREDRERGDTVIRYRMGPRR